MVLVTTLLGAPSIFAAEQQQVVPSAVEMELRRLNREAAEMQVRNDVAAAERLLADEYLFLQADGQIRMYRSGCMGTWRSSLDEPQ
jgi:hypothetical protein